MTQTHPNTDKLRAVAEGATPGPWAVDGDFLVTLDPIERDYERCALADLRYFHLPRNDANAAFIAAANPAVVLALLSRLDRYEKALGELRAWAAEPQVSAARPQLVEGYNSAMTDALGFFTALQTQEGSRG